jgi:hypothetical protein
MNFKLSFATSFAAIAALALTACATSTTPTDETQPTADTSDELRASKCAGMLPHICEVCPDGKSQCAHWTVKNNRCSIEVCAAPTTCVQHVLCTTGSQFDHTACKCVPKVCIQNVLCASTGHFDHATCKCVPN